jgi:hypothetical protein
MIGGSGEECPFLRGIPVDARTGTGNRNQSCLDAELSESCDSDYAKFRHGRKKFQLD